jgi:transcriptional regulator GlxA family with amidase domain
MQVARELVIYMKRPGGQSQFSELLQSQTLTSTAFENLHIWISNNRRRRTTECRSARRTRGHGRRQVKRELARA